jgi:EAL domain-containing protein (putative c-di-GMP-specific phosphodiesterase class I)
VQGYYFSAPQPSDLLRKFFERQKTSRAA